MTAQPVDLTNLREMTDGDKELEQELFAEFFNSSASAIETLGQHCADGESKPWYSAAHALKGSAYNLGATQLGDLCKKAQESHAASKMEKQQMCDGIKQEYEKVRQYLSGLYK